MAAFSAPPILFDIGARVYLKIFSSTKISFNKSRKATLSSTNMASQSRFQRGAKPKIRCQLMDIESKTAFNLRFSLQNEDYHSYYAVHVPTQHYYSSLTPEEEILNNLDQAAKWARDQYGSRAVQLVISGG